MAVEDLRCGVDTRGDVVAQNGADELLGRLMMVVMGDFLEGVVCRGEDSVVGLGGVEELHELLVLVDDFGEDGGVLARGDELVDGLVRRRVAWREQPVHRGQLGEILGEVIRIVIDGTGEVVVEPVALGLRRRGCGGAPCIAGSFERIV